MTPGVQMRIAEGRARLAFRSSLLAYLERNTEYRDAVLSASEGRTMHHHHTMMRLASLLEQRDIALSAHLDLLEQAGWS